ncbi:MAG TPA: hypothetical protein VMU94_25685 [Streptosporangiaceae bacterium]|nr:hypothetical protein [Streptosporangiaceae bacterium]
MAVVFVVFLVAILLVFTLSEGRDRRLARLSHVCTEAAQTARVVRTRGSETIEWLAARLARDQGGRIGLDQLLARPDPAGAERLDGPAET